MKNDSEPREHEPERETDARIDDSLRRSFALPAEPGNAALEAIAVSRRAIDQPRTLQPVMMLLVAAAAALLALISIRTLQVTDPPQEGSLQASVFLPTVQVADLKKLYDEITSIGHGEPRICESPEELAEDLASAYKCCETLRVREDASSVLKGPFDSAQWPGGMMFSGSAAGSTAILIAEKRSQYSCCVDPRLPEESGLEVFTWRLGDLVLTEVTPLSEPHLLNYFRLESQAR